MTTQSTYRLALLYIIFTTLFISQTCISHPLMRRCDASIYTNKNLMPTMYSKKVSFVAEKQQPLCSMHLPPHSSHSMQAACNKAYSRSIKTATTTGQTQGRSKKRAMERSHNPTHVHQEKATETPKNPMHTPNRDQNLSSPKQQQETHKAPTENKPPKAAHQKQPTESSPPKSTHCRSRSVPKTTHRKQPTVVSSPPKSTHCRSRPAPKAAHRKQPTESNPPKAAHQSRPTVEAALHRKQPAESNPPKTTHRSRPTVEAALQTPPYNKNRPLQPEPAPHRITAPNTLDPHRRKQPRRTAPSHHQLHPPQTTQGSHTQHQEMPNSRSKMQRKPTHGDLQSKQEWKSHTRI
jgi:hypothetical protein